MDAPIAPIAGYEDWPAWGHAAGPFESADPAVAALGRVLGLRRRIDPPSVTVEGETLVGTVRIRTLSWSVGFGPRTRAYLLTPADASGLLPGVLGLHAHGGKRWIGAEQLVDLGPDSSDEAIGRRAGGGYGGRSPANDLAARGYAVLVHDTFSWGSRRFDLSRPTPKLAEQLAGYEALCADRGIRPSEAERFDALSGWHEELVAKIAGLLGQSLAGLVLQDDLVALDVLAGLADVDPTRLGAFGLSGGGGRSHLLGALDGRIRSHVVTCMMATFASMMPDYVEVHSWLLNSPGLPQLTEWPDIREIGGRRDTLVQYGLHDPLFPVAGMRAADERMSVAAAAHGPAHHGGNRYIGTFYDVGHEFGVPMQQEAWDFLDRTLAR